MFEELTESQLDFFREIENIGAGNAATALSTMLGRKIDINVPRAEICSYADMNAIIGSPESIVAGVMVGISEDIEGFIMLMLSREDANKLSGALLGMADEPSEDEPFEMDEMKISALKEVSNILIGSYVNAISDLSGMRIDVTVPDLVVDMAGAVIGMIAAAYGAYSDSVLFLETKFIDEAYSVDGHFFLVPDIDSYQKLMEKMGVA